ncbi:condensin complex subunit 2-like [Trichogramma pretiosum]|uniref:condensin complex subunit 2-like n=1 Tax=Trichogramma pretiosum TaxID=7493 RepID=UPI0006C99255|nr:condensin complex subunit 2-like [Trichogramma pretiosum]
MTLLSIGGNSVSGNSLSENESENENFKEYESDVSQKSNISLSIKFSGLSQYEISNQISSCLKLNAENKITDKNAFGLQLIDLFAFVLRKQEPHNMNLQMASACLDVSGKIYAYRVDKVHSDLLKVVQAGRGTKRAIEDEYNEYDEDRPKRKKKKNKPNILSSSQALKGCLETYNPLSLVYCNTDPQTSDKLYQSAFPFHANSQMSLNLFNDVLLDKVIRNYENYETMKINKLDNFSNKELCPSYSNFQFLHWHECPEIESTNTESSVDYHFNLQSPLDEGFVDDSMCRDGSFNDNELFQDTLQNTEIVDFQDVIENQSNPDKEYEYSYLQPEHYKKWNGSRHWRLVFNKKRKVKTKAPIVSKQSDHNSNLVKIEWEHFHNFHNKPVVLLKRLSLPLDKREWDENTLEKIRSEEANHNLRRHFSDSGIGRQRDTDDFEALTTSFQLEDEFNDTDQLDEDGDRIRTSTPINHESFTGPNLISAPTTPKNVFVPYSRIAKKVNMRKLKEAAWKTLIPSGENTNEEIQTTFSEMYQKLPQNLSKINAKILSPALAFVSLLHLSNENNLELSQQEELDDLCINSFRDNQ